MLFAEAVCRKDVYCVLQQLPLGVAHCTAGVYSRGIMECEGCLDYETVPGIAGLYCRTGEQKR